VPKFITIDWGEESGYERTRSDLKDAAHAHDAWLSERGAIVGVAGVPIQVRKHENSGIRADRGTCGPIYHCGFCIDRGKQRRRGRS
jgi:hypothetical protein